MKLKYMRTPANKEFTKHVFFHNWFDAHLKSKKTPQQQDPILKRISLVNITCEYRFSGVVATLAVLLNDFVEFPEPIVIGHSIIFDHDTFKPPSRHMQRDHSVSHFVFFSWSINMHNCLT